MRPGGGRPAAPAVQNQPGQGLPGDRSGLSREAQQAGGAQGIQGGQSGGQQLTLALSKDIGQVMQAQGSGDQNRSQQALQKLGQTYQQGQQSGQLEQVPPMIRQLAESLLGIEKQGEGQQPKKGGGECGGGGESGGAGEAGGASESGGAGGSEGAGEKNVMSEDVLKKLEELLGKDKAEQAKKDSKVPEEVNINIDGAKADGKTDNKTAEGDKKADGDKVAEAGKGKDKKVDGPSKTGKSKSADKPAKSKTAKKAPPKSKAPKKSGGGAKKKAA